MTRPLPLLLLLCAVLGGTEAAMAAEPRQVTVAPLASLVVTASEDAPARVVELHRSTVAAEISARIDALHVEVGDAVQAGAVLADLDCRDYAAHARQARASLAAVVASHDLADYRLARARQLATRDAVSEELLRQRESELATLRAERDARRAVVELAVLQVDRCRVRAPFAGSVVARPGQPGELAAPGTPLVTLVDVARVEVEAPVRRAALDGLAAAGHLLFDDGAATHPLRLRAVLPTVDPRSDTRMVRLAFVDAPAVPGTPGRLLWSDGGRRVPPDLLVRRDGGLGLFLLADDGTTVRFVPLPGAQEGRPVRVDLDGTVRVVVEGRAVIADGDRVRTGP